jgi:hypothetical protein
MTPIRPAALPKGRVKGVMVLMTGFPHKLTRKPTKNQTQGRQHFFMVKSKSSIILSNLYQKNRAAEHYNAPSSTSA